MRALAGRRLAAGGLVLALGVESASWAADPSDWPTYGHDAGGMRYSPLTQITPANVARLKPAWTYRLQANAAATAPSAQEDAQRQAKGLGPQAGAPPNARRRAPRPATSEATPLVVRGLMYVTTPYRRVVALEPESGREVISRRPARRRCVGSSIGRVTARSVRSSCSGPATAC